MLIALMASDDDDSVVAAVMRLALAVDQVRAPMGGIDS